MTLLMHLRAFLVATATVALALVAPPSSPLDPTSGIKTAHAHTFIEMSIDYLAQRANRVVVGTPIDGTSVWESSDGGKRIVTYHRVQVQSNVIGDGDQEIWVRRLGGVVGDVGQVVHGAAILQTGQPILLFLAKRTDRTFSVIGMEQGCFRITVSKQKQVRIERRRMSHAPWPTKTKTRTRPASVLEGKSFEDATRIILEARNRNAK